MRLLPQDNVLGASWNISLLYILKKMTQETLPGVSLELQNIRGKQEAAPSCLIRRIGMELKPLRF